MSSEMSKQSNTSLLLLPVVCAETVNPSVPFSTFYNSYHASLRETLLQLSKLKHQKLDVAVACPPNSHPRGRNFAAFQHMLAGIYRLCCHISTEIGLDVVEPNYVDFRVYLISDYQDQEKHEASPLSGPVFSSQQLAESRRVYSTVLYRHEGVVPESGAQFLEARRASDDRQLADFAVSELHVPKWIAKRATDLEATRSDGPIRTHHRVAVGGTFDNLHEGHKLLLSAFALVLEPSKQPRRLVVGITGDQLLVNKKYASMLESWELRAESTFKFLASIISFDDYDSNDDRAGPSSTGKSLTVTRRNEPGLHGRAIEYHLPGELTIECVEIQDPFGPTITDESISALVVSKETRSGGKAVNDKRKERGWEELEVFEVDVLAPEDKDKDSERDESEEIKAKISSTEIRRRRFEAQQGPKI